MKCSMVHLGSCTIQNHVIFCTACLYTNHIFQAIKETITKNMVPTRGASLRRRTMSLRRITLGRHFHMHEDEKISKPSLLKMLHLNSRDWILITLGCVGALISGIIFPLWSVMYRQSTEALKELHPFEESHPWAASFIALGIAAGFGNFLRVCSMPSNS